MNKNQKGLAHLLPLVLVAIVGIAVVGLLATQSGFISKNTGQPNPTPVPINTETWQTYTDTQIGYSVKYPENIILPGSNCDLFILPASEEERDRVIDIRNSGTEIGLNLKGSFFSFCITGNPGEMRTLTNNPINSKLGNNDAVFTEKESGFSYFLYTPGNSVLRVGARHTNQEDKETINQILSTFEFTEPNPTFTPPVDLPPGSSQVKCEQVRGNWLEEFGECENITADSCTVLQGTFDGCASACRHNPSAEVCIEMCVAVCKL